MTTLQQIELRCPICGTAFRSQAVVSTNSFGGKRTDFHERAAGTQPLPYLIHMCSRCGFSGSERDFTEESDISPTLKERVWNELAPAMASASVVGSEKYEAAAKVAEWQKSIESGGDPLPWTLTRSRKSFAWQSRHWGVGPGAACQVVPASRAWAGARSIALGPAALVPVDVWQVVQVTSCRFAVS